MPWRIESVERERETDIKLLSQIFLLHLHTWLQFARGKLLSQWYIPVKCGKCFVSFPRKCTKTLVGWSRVTTKLIIHLMHSHMCQLIYENSASITWNFPLVLAGSHQFFVETEGNMLLISWNHGKLPITGGFWNESLSLWSLEPLRFSKRIKQPLIGLIQIYNLFRARRLQTQVNFDVYNFRNLKWLWTYFISYIVWLVIDCCCCFGYFVWRLFAIF